MIVQMAARLVAVVALLVTFELPGTTAAIVQGWNTIQLCSLDCDTPSNETVEYYETTINYEEQDFQLELINTTTTACPVIICAPSFWSEWSAWNATCDAHCDHKIRFRDHACISNFIDSWTADKYNCTCPGVDGEFEECSDIEPSCLVPRWTAWNEWEPCPLECGDNYHNRTRVCENGYMDILPDANCTGVALETEMCNRTVKCFFSEWGDWMPWYENCTNICNLNHTRERMCMPHYNSEWTEDPYNCSCSGEFLETENCAVAYCQEPAWGEWTEWSLCTDFCGDNQINRTRKCFNRYNQTLALSDCGTNDTHILECGHINCTFGVWSMWSAWTNCSESCINLSQILERFRTCNSTTEHLWRGETYIPLCPGPSSNYRACNMTAMYRSAGYEWNGWGECTTNCGPGSKSRTMGCMPNVNCDLSVYNGSRTCPCQEEFCEVDGNWGDWGQWSRCTKSCNYGFQGRTRACDDPAMAYNGQECIGPDAAKRLCNPQPCIVNATYSAWSDWTPCMFCINATQSRFRNCSTIAPQNGGLPCNTVKETKTCPLKQCAVVSVTFTAIFKNDTYHDLVCNSTQPGSLWAEIRANLNFYISNQQMEDFQMHACSNGTSVSKHDFDVMTQGADIESV